MKDSKKILGEIHGVLQRIRRLQADAEANQPLPLNRRASHAEQLESERRQQRVYSINIEIGNANAEATRLRKAYADALEAERAPKPAEPSEVLATLSKKRDELTSRLEQLRDARAKHALSGLEGDKKSNETLSKAVDGLAAGVIELENLELAIKEAEARDLKEERARAERNADEKFRAGVAAAEELVDWAEKFDNLLGYIGAHFAKLPDLQKTLARSGASIDTDRTNMIFSAAARDRAAKAAGLHRVFSIDATVSASKLGDAFRALLKSAIRRPQKEGKVA